MSNSARYSTLSVQRRKTSALSRNQMGVIFEKYLTLIKFGAT